MTRPANLPELAAHLAGETPATVMCSGVDMRALLAYIAELEVTEFFHELADEVITDQATRISVLEAALRPLAMVAEFFSEASSYRPFGDMTPIANGGLNMGHARAARRALERK
jgi:hypothetical protein